MTYLPNFYLSYLQLYVKVVDAEGESSLIWSQPSYTASIPEQAGLDLGVVATVSINSTLSLVPPRDLHRPSGTLLYGFHNAQDARTLALFGIDTITGEVSVTKGAPLDRETLPRHILTLKARNTANTYGFVRLTIDIEEWNDHPPVFYGVDGRYPARMEVRVPETLAVGSLIAQVSV